MTIFRIEETAEHCSVYEVEAESKEEALAKSLANPENCLTEEFWGAVHREVTEK